MEILSRHVTCNQKQCANVAAIVISSCRRQRRTIENTHLNGMCVALPDQSHSIRTHMDNSEIIHPGTLTAPFRFRMLVCWNKWRADASFRFECNATRLQWNGRTEFFAFSSRSNGALTACWMRNDNELTVPPSTPRPLSVGKIPGGLVTVFARLRECNSENVIHQNRKLILCPIPNINPSQQQFNLWMADEWLVPSGAYRVQCVMKCFPDGQWTRARGGRKSNDKIINKSLMKLLSSSDIHWPRELNQCH